MKKWLIILLCSSYCMLTLGVPEDVFINFSNEYFARSFMFTRPVYANITTEQALWHNFIHHKKHNHQAVIQCTAEYQHTRTDHAAARYFLLKGRNELLVAGDQSINAPCRDIRAEWLNLPSEFRGKMKLNPQQKQCAVVAEYNQNLHRWCHHDVLHNWWIDITLPFVWMQNSLHLTQFDVISTQTPIFPGAPVDIIQAFAQPEWQFGKIVPERSYVGVGDMKIKIGLTHTIGNLHDFAFYFGLVVPTAAWQNPGFLFDAVAGYNGHIGINAGVSFNILTNRCATDRLKIYFFFDLDDIFFVRHTQCRTISLRDRNRNPKPLSRFLLLTKNCPTAQIVPGVNVLTLKILEHPYNYIDLSTGFRLDFHDCELELGFGMWGHGQEKMELAHPDLFPTDYGIAGPGPLKPNAQGILVAPTASASTIAFQSAADPVFTPITCADLDLLSASAGSALNYRVFGSFGYQPTFQHTDLFVGAGYFVDFPIKNGALYTWQAWVKTGISF